MIVNTAGQSISAGLVNASTGGAFNGTVTCYVTIDQNAQAIGQYNSGICIAKGNGDYQYLPTQAETNGSNIVFTFIGSGAVPQTVNVATVTGPQNAALTAISGTTSKTVRVMITDCLKRINVISGATEQAPADMLSDGLSRFNDWVDSVCSNERLTIYGIQTTSFTLTPNKASYTVGPSGDIPLTARPEYVDHLTFTDTTVTPAFERPIFLVTNDAWASIPIKSQTANYPTFGWWNPTYSAQQATLSLWLVPTNSGLTGKLYWPSQVTNFGSLDSTIALPPGYNRFIRDNVALELWPEYRENVPPDTTLVQTARESKENIKRKNVTMMDLGYPAELLPHAGYRSNIYTGL